MQEIKCPRCGEVFQVDESGYAAILKQVRDKEFAHEIHERETALRAEKENAVELAVTKAEAAKDAVIAQLSKQLAARDAAEEAEREKRAAERAEALSAKDRRIAQLQNDLTAKESEAALAVRDAVQARDEEIARLKNDLALAEKEFELKARAEADAHAAVLRQKDEQIEYYKDFKARQSTKMVGESLEVHCETEFNKLRAAAFPNAYFEKDNDASGGSKGDFIYRESSPDGIEFLSIMFEMKNEMDETAVKHKNEDFFHKLDADRTKKKCEYAVLVSLLEADSELYNTGIVDVSYRYPKMYVVRPQFFIPLITILRNAALKTLETRRELEAVRNQNLDITHFEEAMDDFKRDFARNVELADRKFQTAIAEIDKTIEHLQKTKEALLSSDHNLQIANRKADDLSIRRLTKGNPTMREKFAALGREDEDA